MRGQSGVSLRPRKSVQIAVVAVLAALHAVLRIDTNVGEHNYDSEEVKN